MTLLKKKINHVGIFLKDENEDDDDDDDEGDKAEESGKPDQLLGRGRRTAVLDSKLRVRNFFVVSFCFADSVLLHLV